MKIHHILSVALMTFISASVLAQPMRSSRPEYLLQAAEEKVGQKDYYAALEFYDKYYEATKDKTVAYEMAQLNMKLKDYAKAETWFSRALQKDKKAGITGEENPDARFYYALMLKMNEKYDESLIVFEDFIKESKDEAKVAQAKNELEGVRAAMRMKDNTKWTFENLGNKINQPNSEYAPVVTADGETLYYAAFDKADLIRLDGKEGDYYVKIFKSTKSGVGEWSKPSEVGANVNRQGMHQGNVALSPDGKVMYFTRFSLTGNDVTESKLYYSVLKNGEWGPSNEVKGINGDYIVKNPAIGELYGKEVLFFASNMESTKGGFDIFYATKVDESSFGTPTNLGSVINTSADEETPFYKEGKLYFSSNGHVSIGGMDIFSSAWNGTSWSKPENMGKGFNSAANDMYFSLDPDGNGYFTSNRPGGRSLKSKTCCEDIYVARRPAINVDLIVDAADPDKKALKAVEYRLIEVKNNALGDVIDTKTVDKYGSPLVLKRDYAVVLSKNGYYNDTVRFSTTGLKESQTIKKTGTLRPLPIIAASVIARAYEDTLALTGVSFRLIQLADGKAEKADTKVADLYTSKLAIGKSFVLIASKEGYTSDTAYFNTMDIKGVVEIEKTLKLKEKFIEIVKDKPIVLNNIYYKLNKFEATTQHMEDFTLAQQSLDYLYDIMAQNPTLVIEVSSHTDSRGSATSNEALSQKRAEGVVTYLVAKGITSNRLVAKGYGETQLVNGCKDGVKCSEEEHLQNRRTEFKIISGPTSIKVKEQKSAVRG